MVDTFDPVRNRLAAPQHRLKAISGAIGGPLRVLVRSERVLFRRGGPARARQFCCFFSSAGSLRTHSTPWGWQATPIFEHVIFPASRRQVTQRSVHAAQPGGRAWTAGLFGGTEAGRSGTISADGNVRSAAQFAHGAGASAAPVATIMASPMTALAMTRSGNA
jgi:hypothetical protein